MTRHPNRAEETMADSYEIMEQREETLARRYERRERVLKRHRVVAALMLSLCAVFAAAAVLDVSSPWFWWPYQTAFVGVTAYGVAYMGMIIHGHDDAGRFPLPGRQQAGRRAPGR